MALQELWKLLDVPQEERDTFGDDLLEQVRPGALSSAFMVLLGLSRSLTYTPQKQLT